MVGKTVTVRGGTTLKELVGELGRRSMSLPVLPAITEQTITGAIATGTLEVEILVCVL